MCLSNQVVAVFFVKLIFVNFKLSVTALFLQIPFGSFDSDCMSLNVFRRFQNDVFYVELSVAQLAYDSFLCSFPGLVIDLRIRVDPCFASAWLTATQATVGTVDHLVFVLEWMSTGRALLDTLLIQIRPRSEEDWFIVVECEFVGANVKLS